MRTKISELTESKSVLEKNYISQADAAWKDDVQTKFFNEHIESIRNEYSTFLDAMEETAYTFEDAERIIRSLL